jgi:hypothetical protein
MQHGEELEIVKSRMVVQENVSPATDLMTMSIKTLSISESGVILEVKMKDGRARGIGLRAMDLIVEDAVTEFHLLGREMTSQQCFHWSTSESFESDVRFVDSSS